MIVIITLHNLAQRSPGLANEEHFHFRTHITNFIDKNWDSFFFKETRRKRKNLLGTIAGILSQHSPEIFSSGTEIIGSIGWWKLTHAKWSPIEYEKFIQSKAKRALDSEDLENDVKAKRLKAEAEFSLWEESSEFDLDIEPINEKTDLIFPEPGENLNDALEESEEILEIEGLVNSPRPFTIKKEIFRSTNIKSSQESLLDRYRVSTKEILQSLVVGSTLHERFHSPLTGRILHPFIYRDTKTFPRWLKLMCEMKFVVNGKTPERSTIDFCYARPHHLAAVNSLLQKEFWPNIDMSESLNYPDFTVVALYKKLVVGCAFLVPDACHNEAYISFLAVRPGWDRCGIASFMLYHLTQTSNGKDITLHVSASNPAICLYQKFGFKTEELVLGFYEKYLPPDSPHSPHALFLRLAR